MTLARPLLGGGERVVLDGVTASMDAGSATVVSGSTGAGKSSLLGLLGGLVRPTSGVVRAGGEPISRWTAPHRDRYRRGVGMLFQEPRLFADMTALENVLVPLLPRAAELSGLAAMRRRAGEALERAGALHLGPRVVSTLSGGERQRVSLARALAGRPEVLLLDEPTAHQDDSGARVVLDAAAAALGWGATVVVATHDPRVSEGWAAASVVLALVEGRLEAAR